MDWLLLVFVCLQFIFQFWVYFGLKKIKSYSPEAFQNKVNAIGLSVVVVARNESGNIGQIISDILKQSHSNYELILVSDQSDDQTLSIMQTFQKKDNRVKVLEIPKAKLGGKKHALEKAINSAVHDCLVFTDADCRITDSRWLEKYAYQFSLGHDFVIGSGMMTTQGGWVGMAHGFETLKTAMHYFSSAANGFPYMCVGRSMAYSKALFLKVGGFSKLPAQIESGTDDLFLQQCSKTAKFGLIPDAVSWSKSPDNLVGWLRQRKRHLSAGNYYPAYINICLVLNDFTTIVLPVALVYALLNWGVASQLILFFILVRSFMVCLNIKKMLRFVGEFQGVSQHCMLEIPMCYINALISVFSQMIKNRGWKINQ